MFSKKPSKGGPGTYDLMKRKFDLLKKNAPIVKEQLTKQIPKYEVKIKGDGSYKPESF